MVLIVSQKNDSHVDFLLERLNKQRRKKIVRFNTEEFPTSASLMLSDNPSLIISEKKYFLYDVSSIWYRRPADPCISDQVKDAVAKKYAMDESWNLLNSLWEGMTWPLWVNKPSRIKIAKHKWAQSLIANQIGFICPKTLATNNPNEAQDFCKEVGNAIVKPIYKGHFKADDGWKMIYTNPISIKDGRIKDVELAPAIFQEYIPKKIELRVTVVRNQVFACAIESQKNLKTQHDWRHYDLDNTPHYPAVLPEKIAQMCIKLLHHYELEFGAIDLILTPDDQYVFLELNPNGQWAWIEDMSGLPICSAMINLLFSNE